MLYYIENKDQESLYILGTVMAITLYTVLYILYISERRNNREGSHFVSVDGSTDVEGHM